MFDGTLAYPSVDVSWALARTPAFHDRPTAPCVWCGSKGFVHNRPGPNARAPWAVVCSGCEARGPTAATPGEAIERWDAGPACTSGPH